HAWTTHSAPWYYGDNGNWLVASPLKPGEHTFAVRALTADNQVAIDKFQSAGDRAAAAAHQARRQVDPRRHNAPDRQARLEHRPQPVVDAQYLPNGNVVLVALIINRPDQTPAS